MTRKGYSVALGAGTLATLGLAACGASSTATAQASRTTSAATTPAATLSPTPGAAKNARLIAVDESRAANYDVPYVEDIIRDDGMLAVKTTLAPTTQVTGPFGSGFFTQADDSAGNVALASLDSRGQMTTLATVPHDAFISAGAAPDGSEWMILEKGTNGGCGPGRTAKTQVFMQRAGQDAQLIATLPDDQPYQVYAWTSLGVVLTEGNQGCLDLALPANTLPTTIVDPATGAISPGPSDCVLQAVSVDGTIACTPKQTAGASPAPTAAAIRLISRGGANLGIPRSAVGLTDPNTEIGGYAFSPDGQTLALSVAGPVGHGTEAATVLLVDTRSGRVQVVMAAARFLVVAGWLDKARIVAVSSPDQLHSADSGTGAQGTYVYDVTNGAMAKISALAARAVSS